MRISTQQLFQQGLNGLMDKQLRSAETLEQLATGRQINRVSDDPVGAARIQELERAINQQTGFLDNIDRTAQRLGIEENALDSAGNVIQRVRELTVQASSDTTGPEGRQLIAAELRQRLEELRALANSQSGEGEYIFAGAQSESKPFVFSGDEVAYVGDSVQRELLIGPGTTMAEGDTGDSVFMRIRNGNGITAAAPVTTNTGTGVIRPEAGTNTSVYDGREFAIRFTDGETYEAFYLDDSSPVLENPGAPSTSGTASFSLADITGDFSGGAANELTFQITDGTNTDTVTLNTAISDSATALADLNADLTNFTATESGGVITLTSNAIGTGTTPQVVDGSVVAGVSAPQTTFAFTSSTDGSNGPVTGTYSAGSSITVNGVRLVIDGAPEAGDTFEVTPARYESAFKTIDKLLTALEQTPADELGQAGQRQVINDSLAQLDRVESNILKVRASVGGRLNTLEDVQNTQDSVRFSLEKLVSEVRDLDFAEAASRLQQELFTLQASQQAFTRIQGNSLFNYI